MSARADIITAKYDYRCPVCDGWKNLGAFLCRDCMKQLPQPRRNIMAASDTGYCDVVQAMRIRRHAAAIGLRVRKG